MDRRAAALDPLPPLGRRGLSDPGNTLWPGEWGAQGSMSDDYYQPDQPNDSTTVLGRVLVAASQAAKERDQSWLAPRTS